MAPLVLAILHRPWLFGLALILLFVPRARKETSRVLVAAEPVGQVRLARTRLPQSFEPNLGQADPRAKFLSRGRGYTLFLTKDGAVLALQKPEVRSQESEEEASLFPVVPGQLLGNLNSKFQIQNSVRRLPFPASDSLRPSPRSPTSASRWPAPSVVRLRLLGANPSAKFTGLDELPGKSNYFLGNDPKKWRTNVPTFARVKCENIYPGVDLIYNGKGGQLEYEFVVAPGADPSVIALAIDAEGDVGSRQKEVGSGQLSVVSRQWAGVGHNDYAADEVGYSGHVIPQSKIQNRKSKMDSSLRIATNGDLIVTTGIGEVRFQKPVVYQVESPVDSRQSTVKSPAANERSRRLFRRSQIHGRWQAPTGRGQRTTDDGQLTSANPKSNIQNRKLIDGRYVLKPEGEVTFEIPPYDTTRPLIIDPVLSYSTYLGGSDTDYANAIAVDSSGNAYVTGYTASTDFPLANPAQNSPGGGTCSDGVDTVACFDAFVAKLNPSGSALVYSTYLGGSNEDYGTSIALDASGDAYVTGSTNSTDFPMHQALQSANAGGFDAFATELSADGASLLYSTYWGGSSDDIGTGIAVDSSGNAYISGYTDSPDFPVTSGALQANYGGGTHNGFVIKLNPGGAALGYSTFLGGSGDDYTYGVAVDSTGDASLTGATNSVNFPTAKAFQPTYAGGLCALPPNTFPCFDAFVAKLNPAGSALIYSTYLGGTGSDYGYAIALDASSNAYVTGFTTSTNFPTTVGAFQSIFGGCYDVFVAKLDGAGSTLAYSTYLGGTGTEIGYGVAVDSSGRAFVTGYNYGGDFPTKLPLEAQNAGFYDAFLSVLNPSGSSLDFSTYLGGSLDEVGRGITLDPSGNAYVTGGTFSLDFPITSGSFQPSYTGGPYDAFVTKISLVPTPSLSISPPSFAFANQAVGTTSSSQTATLTNVGAAGLIVTTVVAAGNFAESDTCVSSSPIAANGTCSVNVTFTPTAPGTRTGSLTITDNATIRPQTVQLTGTGVGPAASLSPVSLWFGNQLDGTTSAAETALLWNTGNVTLNITNVSIAGTNSGDFSQTNNCGPSLSPSATCAISLTFTPAAAGSRNGTLTITDNANPATQTVGLAGIGTVPVVSLSPTSLTFPAQPVGTSSSPQGITLSNTGSAALTIAGMAASGDFSQTNTCGSSLATSASCAISVTFTPTAAGSRSGVLTITDNASPGTQTVGLTGMGTAPVVSLSPASLTFPAQPVGTSSSPQTLTLSNAGNAVLTIAGITASGDFSQTNTCSSSLAPSATCILNVTFKPTAAGTRTGTVTITDNAIGSPQTVALTGAGEDFTFTVAAGSPTSASVSPGGAANYTLSIAALGGFDQNVTFACAGAPSEAACTVAPSSLTPGSSSTNLTVQVATTAPSTGATRPNPLPPVCPELPWPWLLRAAALAALGSLARAAGARVQAGAARSRAGLIILAALLLFVGAMAACGGGGSTGLAPNNPGTPAGSYALTVTGKWASGSANLSHSVNLTLQVK